MYFKHFSILDIIDGLKEDGIEPRILLSKLEHIKAILTSQLDERKKDQAQNNVPDITISAPEIGEDIGEDVAEWLASTFTKPQEVSGILRLLLFGLYKFDLQRILKKKEVPALKSVANAIRTGLFIERIYSGLSTSHMLIISDEIQEQLKVSIKIFF